MTERADLLGHIIEMKEAIARVEENTKGLPARVTALEHGYTAAKAQFKVVAFVASSVGACVAWVFSHIGKS